MLLCGPHMSACHCGVSTSLVPEAEENREGRTRKAPPRPRCSRQLCTNPRTGFSGQVHPGPVLPDDSLLKQRMPGHQHVNWRAPARGLALFFQDTLNKQPQFQRRITSSAWVAPAVAPASTNTGRHDGELPHTIGSRGSTEQGANPRTELVFGYL